MNNTEYLRLSTRLVKDLKEWIEATRNHQQLTADQLTRLDEAAAIIEQTTVRIEEPHG